MSCDNTDSIYEFCFICVWIIAGAFGLDARFTVRCRFVLVVTFRNQAYHLSVDLFPLTRRCVWVRWV